MIYCHYTYAVSETDNLCKRLSNVFPTFGKDVFP